MINLGEARPWDSSHTLESLFFNRGVCYEIGTFSSPTVAYYLLGAPYVNVIVKEKLLTFYFFRHTSPFF